MKRDKWVFSLSQWVTAAGTCSRGSKYITSYKYSFNMSMISSIAIYVLDIVIICILVYLIFLKYLSHMILEFH